MEDLSISALLLLLISLVQNLSTLPLKGKVLSNKMKGTNYPFTRCKFVSSVVHRSYKADVANLCTHILQFSITQAHYVSDHTHSNKMLTA